MDATVQFYSQVLDSLHFYLVHLFECGLRTEQPNPNTADDDEEANQNMYTYFDKAFDKVAKLINERQHIRSGFNRLEKKSTNSKFNIQMADGSSDTVYMDEAV
eukprot:725319_1